jgi:hypothetical protein
MLYIGESESETSSPTETVENRQLTVPNTIAVPTADQRSVPNTIAVPDQRSVPNAIAVPDQRSVPNTIAVPDQRSVPNAIAVPTADQGYNVVVVEANNTDSDSDSTPLIASSTDHSIRLW